MAVTALTPTDPTTDPTAVPKPTPATKPVAATPVAPLTNPVPNTPATPTAAVPKPMIDPVPPTPAVTAVPTTPNTNPVPSNLSTSAPASGSLQAQALAGAGTYASPVSTNPTTAPLNAGTTPVAGSLKAQALAGAGTYASSAAPAPMVQPPTAAGGGQYPGGTPGAKAAANGTATTDAQGRPLFDRNGYPIVYSDNTAAENNNAGHPATAAELAKSAEIQSTAGPSPYTGVKDLGNGMSAPVLSPDANEASTMGINLNSPNWYQQYQAIKGGAPNTNNVTTLQNGTLTQNGKVTALENGTGAFVDPITGALTNAGGAIGAQSSTATAGVPGSVNGTPIVQWLQSQGMLQPGTPGATGSMAPGTPTIGGNGSPVGNPTGATTTGVASGINSLLPQGPSSATSSPYANTQQIVPGGVTDLTSQLITPGAGTDRLQLAKQYEDAWNAATNPQFAADQRDALRSAAAGGALGSGQLNTTLGSLTGNRDLQRNAAMANFLTNAQQGSIEDAFRKLGILQQQQGFQAGQQNTAFNQGLLQSEVGNMNNPDTLLAELAAQYNQQAGQAAGSVGQLAQASSANQNGQIPAWLLPLLQGYGGGSGTTPTVSAPSASGGNYGLPTGLNWGGLTMPKNPLSVSSGGR